MFCHLRALEVDFHPFIGTALITVVVSVVMLIIVTTLCSFVTVVLITDQ